MANGWLEENKTKSWYSPSLRLSALPLSGCCSMDKIVLAGYHALKLIHFFTCGEDEVKCWTVRVGMVGNPLSTPLIGNYRRAPKRPKQRASFTLTLRKARFYARRECVPNAFRICRLYLCRGDGV